jgi:hypothetical protein
MIFAFLKRHPELAALRITSTNFVREPLIPPWFYTHFRSLTSITMVNCGLTTLPNAMKDCVTLSRVDVGGNRFLTRIEPLALDGPALTYIFIDGTPLENYLARTACIVRNEVAELRYYVKHAFTYREARASTMTLLALARRHLTVSAGFFFGRPGLKDVTVYMIAPALYSTREEEAWRARKAE